MTQMKKKNNEEKKDNGNNALEHKVQRMRGKS